MKKVWFILVCVVVGIAAGPLILWYQATQLPTWYATPTATTNGVDLRDRDQIEQARQTVETKLTRIQPAADGTTTVELTDIELNDLLAAEIAAAADTQNLMPAVRQINTTIANGKISSGAVINLSDLPPNALSQQKQAVFNEAIKTFPGLAGRDVYIGVEGTPTVDNGQLRLQNARIQVGNLRLSLADVAQRLGVSEATLEQEINRQLTLQRINLQDIQLENNTVQIRGRVNGAPDSVNTPPGRAIAPL